MNSPAEISQFIKTQAKELGFEACGISKARFLKKESEEFKEKLQKGFHGDLTYLENNLEKRFDPRLLHEGTRSVISVLQNYYPEKLLPEEDNFKIAKYAYGKDYHIVLKNKLKQLVFAIENKINRSLNARVFVDSAPVLDRAWAVKAGLGFIGKNSILIRKNTGSFFFIGEILCDLPLEYDRAFETEHCGSCTRCLDACPTGAIVAPYKLDARKCISYLTIEHKGKLPEDLKDKFNDWIFGCDICQDVCPHNRFAKPHHEETFLPNEKLFSMNKEKWKNLTEEEFKKLFKQSAVKRTKFEGLRRNIDFLLR